MRLTWLSMLIFISILSSCVVRTSQTPTPLMATELTPFDKQITGWVTGKHCSTYLFGLRFSDPMRGAYGKRVGHLSGGAILGGQAPDSDSADALYQALQTDLGASYLLVPRYDVNSSGFIVFGTRPIFGKRCSSVKALGVSVYKGLVRSDRSSGKRTKTEERASPSTAMTFPTVSPSIELNCKTVLGMIAAGFRGPLIIETAKAAKVARGTSICLSTNDVPDLLIDALKKYEPE